MDYIRLTDQYGNVDTNQDGVINSLDDGYQTDVLQNAVGPGANGLTRDTGLFQSGYNDDGTLRTGDWAGDLTGTENALDNLLSSEDFNNGRVPDIRVPNNIFTNLDNEVIINSDSRANAVKGIVEETVLSDTFFSDINTKVIQDTIRYRVFQDTNEVISYQSSQELFIIMRSILLQHGNFKVSQANLYDEVRNLNKYVVDYSVGKITPRVQQYAGYIEDLHSLPQPNDRPLYSGGSNNNTYDLSAFVGI